MGQHICIRLAVSVQGPSVETSLGGESLQVLNNLWFCHICFEVIQRLYKP